MERAIVKISKVDYGKVGLQINKMMLKEYNKNLDKDITINRLAVMTGTKFETMKRYVNNQITRVDFDLLSRICYVLDCDSSDIIKYERKND